MMDQIEFGWLVLTDPVELVPTGDIKQHIAGPGCWCSPTEDEDGTLVHWAADGREQYETGQGRMH